jgi:aldehyde:ferredoxin oxidoreductase
LNTKRRISFRGSFVQSKEKHLKQGEKISNLENALQNLIHLPLSICKKNFEKDLQKEFAKIVVQAWSKMLNKKETIHAYLVNI